MNMKTTTYIAKRPLNINGRSINEGDVYAKITHPDFVQPSKVIAGLYNGCAHELREVPGDHGQASGGGEGDDPPAVNATDSAIALAAEHEIDLAVVEGSGAEGRITKPDVEKHIETSGGEGD